MTTIKDLRPGDRVHLPPTLNSSGFVGTVESVEPWVLTAGPRAGQQARAGRRPLWTVRVTDCAVTEPPRRPLAGTDALVDRDPARRLAVTETEELEVLAP